MQRLLFVFIALIGLQLGYSPIAQSDVAAATEGVRMALEVKGPFARPMSLAWIPSGSFTMGSPANETGRRANESPQTQVTITQGYWMATTEVTHGQWKALMATDMVDQARLAQTDDTIFHLGAGSMPLRDYFRLKKDGDTLQLVGSLDDDVPMIWVSWDEATQYARKLTELARAQGVLPEGYVFRLPTEAEWEYAARAGTKGATYAGDLVLNSDKSADAMRDIAWYAGTARDSYRGRGIDTSKWISNKEGMAGLAGPRTVATKAPNAWGLYDMLGNAAEWCVDFEGPLPGGSVSDWKGAASSKKGHIRRGGGWSTFAINARSGYRNAHEHNFRWVNLGFRLVLARPL